MVEVYANHFTEDLRWIKAAILIRHQSSMLEMKEQGVAGKEFHSLFLLARVAELTGGDSLQATFQLVFNNASPALQIAIAL